jgi:hypothetical protein
LVLRECGLPAAGSCSQCAATLCLGHLGTGLCASCSLTSTGRRDEYTEEEATRSEYYRTYQPGAEGAEYGGGSFFTERDTESLSRPGEYPPRKSYDASET